MQESGFNFIIDLHRNKKLWKRNENWKWEQQFEILPSKENEEEINKQRLPKLEDCHFQITKSRRADYKDDHYILIGKGHYLENINN